MVHHAAVAAGEDDEEAARFLGYQRYHQAQQWPDIAYHLGIGRSGRLFELRDPGTAGDTFTEYDPAGWFLILVDGNFDEQQPSDAQLSSLAMSVAWAWKWFGLQAGQLASHREVAATTCPGDRLYEQLSGVGQVAESVHDAGGVELRPTCPVDQLAKAWST